MSTLSIVLLVILLVYFLPNAINRYRYWRSLKCNCSVCTEVRKTQLILYLFYAICSAGSLITMIWVG